MKLLCFLMIFSFQAAFLFAQEKTNFSDANSIEILSAKEDSCNAFVTSRLLQRIKYDTVAVKRILERALKCPLHNYLQLHFYTDLAEIYYREGQYRKSLELIELYDSAKHKVKRPHNPYSLAGYLGFAYKKANCYEGLHQTDSAISALTPYAFFQYKTFGFFYDSTGYDRICNYYLDLLLKKYSPLEIKTELKKAEASFYYHHTVSNKVNQPGYIQYKINCGFQFLSCQVNYLDIGLLLGPNHKIEERFSRDYQLNYFKETPLYRAIQQLDIEETCFQ